MFSFPILFSSEENQNTKYKTENQEYIQKAHQTHV
jgi:hypothetical protein